MTRFLEASGFFSIALILHLAILGLQDEAEGAAASGEGGDARVSLQAASAQMGELVEEWERPPEAPAEPIEMAPAPPPEPVAEAPKIELALEAVPQPVTPSGLALPQMTEAPPPVDRSITQPPPPPEPEPEPKPEPEPVVTAERASIPPVLRPDNLAKPKPEPKKKPAARSAPSEAQRAAGSGGGSNAGAAQQSANASITRGQMQTHLARWGAQISRHVERRKRYPREASGATGRAQLQITVSRDGRLAGAQLIRSSGQPSLDRAALNAARSVKRFPAAPKELTDSVYAFAVTLNFEY
ncbi:outer membrane transport energization protein TonB [Poseidonocella pacifica]|uniref:Outer membrane transport energization protein TonB n=1 Tax=Poseidonocella pacifica TaxID=871651 RepID=A0A1I0V668_9RHOB|nr:energy transducer TonB [Poseidonocella pacifica]SFA71845.1 outer membrane transport energization protein TonB [Poseidonocella pacifica]